MKTKTNIWWRDHLHHRIPLVAQVLELAVGLAIFSSVTNFWGVLVRADPDITPPSVPINLQVSSQAASEIDITWSASTDDTAVVGYHVYRNGTQIGAPTTTSYADTGLTPNTSYTYTVSAYDAASNESAQSSGLATSTLADTSPPSVPVNLHQTGETVSSVTIAWNPAADNVGVTGYRIYRNGSFIQSQVGTSFTDSGLAVYSGYSYNVTSYDAAGNTSNLSATLVGSTAQDTTPPSVPDNIQEPAQTITTVSLSWNASTDNVGVAGYHVYRNGSLVGSPGGTSFMDTGLNVGSQYVYTITAYDAAGNVSNASAPFSASSSTDTTPPSVPLNSHTTGVFDTSIALAWNASTDNVAVTGYKVYRNGTLVGSPASNSFTDSGLSPVTNYSYTIEAFDAANNTSAASQALNVTTAYDTTPPSVPGGLSSSVQTDQSITLAWNASTDNVGVSGYDVYRNGSLITTTVGTSYTDAGLSVDTSYTYTVRADDASGNNSSHSTPLVISTLPDEVPPTTPANLASPSQTTTSVDLTWNTATDDVEVTGYHIYRNGMSIAIISGTSYDDTNLQYNTSYSYSVSSIDDNNNVSTISNPIAVSTLPDTTPPTVSVTAPSDGQSVDFTIPFSANASDDLDLNRVEFYVDSSLYTTVTSAPFTANWNSYDVHNGTHTITAVAYDATGNSSSQAVTIDVVNPPPALVGDLNGDHKVNILDLSIFLSHWGKPGLGDFNNNGKVDIFDLSVLLSHYGEDDSNYQ